jgi:hypothetical protein
MHGVRQSCHSWRESGNRIFPAMILLIGLLILAAAAIAASVVALRTDGYGRLVAPPRSHPWEEAPRSIR